MSQLSRKLRADFLRARIYSIRDQRQTERELESGLFLAGNVRPLLLRIMRDVVNEQEGQKDAGSGSSGVGQV